MPNKWIDGLKSFNGSSPVWSIPKKNTPQYNLVKKLMTAPKGSVDTKVRDLEKKTQKSKTKNSMKIDL